MLKSIQNPSVLLSVISFPLIFSISLCFITFYDHLFSLFLAVSLVDNTSMLSCLRPFVPSCFRAFVYWCLFAFSHSSLHPFVSSSLKAFCAFVAWSFASLILSYLLFLNYIQQLYFLWLITCCSSHLIKMCTCSV